MLYLSRFYSLFISLLLSITILHAEDRGFTHMTQTKSESTQLDSGKMEIQTTLKQDITFKNHLEVTSPKENVDSLLGDIHQQLIQINDSVTNEYNLLKKEMLLDVDLMRRERKLEAKAALVYPIFSIISFLFLLVFRARGQPIGVSIFGLTLVACIVLTLINLSEIIKYFVIDDFSILYILLNK